MRRRHFNPGDKRYYRCLDYQGYCPICIAASNKVGSGQQQIRKASETFGANILVYDTDNGGHPTQPLNAEVYFWAFGADKFVQIRSIINEWGPIENIDLTLNCIEAQFQKVTLSPAKTCYYSSDANFQAACDKKVAEDSYPLDKFLCREVPIIDLVKAFKLDINSYVPQEILNQIAGGPSAQDLANNQQGQAAPAPKASTQQQYQAPPQEAQNIPTQQAPQQAPAAGYTAPAPNSSNFADLNNLTSLL
jgi:hypothetical protein